MSRFLVVQVMILGCVTRPKLSPLRLCTIVGAECKEVTHEFPDRIIIHHCPRRAVPFHGSEFQPSFIAKKLSMTRTSMRKWRNCTTTSFKRWFRLLRWPRCDPSGFDVYLDQRTSELTVLSQVQAVYIGIKVEGHFRCQFGCRFVFPDGHLAIVLLQADCGFWVCAVVVGSAGHEIDLAGSEGLDGTRVDIIKPQVDRFVFPVAHDVIVPAGRPS